MAELKYIKGDVLSPLLLENETAIIPHVCNNIGAWGAGFVLALSKKWEQPEKMFKASTISRKNSKCVKLEGSIDFVPVEKNIYVSNMYAQDKIRSKMNPQPIKYDWLEECMGRVRDLIIYRQKKYSNEIFSIHTPKFGSGLAGGDWKIIEKLIIDIWVNQNISVTVYEL